MNNIFEVPIFIVLLMGSAVIILALLALVSLIQAICEELKDND